MNVAPVEGPTRRLRRAYPKTVTAILVVIALLVVVDAVLILRWMRYKDETTRLRSGMTDSERQRTDVILASEKNRVAVMLELIRRQAAGDRDIHLSVSLDSGLMRLEREGALLREMQVEVGRERVVGTPPDTLRIVPPLGARSLQRLLGPKDAWEAPRWVYADRGLPPPEDRRLAGALGRNALLLSDGAVIYSIPDSGVLADSAYILPGAIRANRADLRAIAPNLTAGTKIYFY